MDLSALTLDQTDDRLIELLREDARASTAQLARRLGLSRSTVQARIERLQRRGVIAGFTVVLGKGRDPRRLQAQVMISLDPKKSERVIRALERMAIIRSLRAISGRYDLSAMLAAQTTEEIDEALDVIGRMDGIERTHSHIILSTKWER